MYNLARKSFDFRVFFAQIQKKTVLKNLGIKELKS